MAEVRVIDERQSPVMRSLVLSTAADALRGEEVDRTRGFVRLGGPIALAAIVATLLLPGDPTLRLVLASALAVTGLLSMVVYRTLRDESALHSPAMSVLAVACVACGTIANLYCGFFSSAPLVIALGVYFFCRTESRFAAYTIYVLVAASHLAIAILITTGVIRDYGFAPLPARIDHVVALAGHSVAQFGYAAAFWLARSTREASLRAIDQLQHATRDAAMRLAQLDEARDDLDRALMVGGPGRFTGAVVGSWELASLIGRGGMGEVYEATHVESGEIAAVKLLRRELMIERKHVERFVREVRAASALDSPHVVRVIEASSPDEAVAFLAMERLRGETLSSMLRDEGTLKHDRVIELVTQLSAVLELARLAGVVHRDIKPPNIFRTDDGVWKLLDFGVAVLGDSSGTLTQGGVIGTPGYMAPEQAKGEAVDHRADVYAVGAVIYRCVTGRAPFTGSDQAAILYAMVHTMPARPGALATVDRDVDRVLARALAKRRGDRYASVRELAEDLAAAFAGQLSRRSRATADA
ncbi:MAG TPA: serine/threonine-protein kinase, partial [Kofleriaceae bacterium]|nr:serine/threonine-protein kinase [Kofleriaceae bacterium]